MKPTNPTNSTSRRDGRSALLGDTRGVSAVLGAILMFALVLMLIVLFQVTLVPSLNKAIEFDHNERVQGDMEALQADLLSASATGAPADMTVETGVRYPERAFLLNPPPVSGEFRTHPGRITFDGFSSRDPETADFWDGDSMTPYETRTLAYAVDYNEYGSPPTTVYEYSTLYNRFDDDVVLPLGNGKLISGNRITLVVLDGDLSTASTRSVTSTLDPVSAPARTTLLTGNGVAPNISVTSQLSETTWRDEILAPEMGKTVQSVTKAGNQVTITLSEDVVYEVRMTKIGIGSGYESRQSPAYVRTEAGNGSKLIPGESHEVVFEVLDEYNNPVAGIDVTATVSPERGTLDARQSTTDEEGRAVFTYTAGVELGAVTIDGRFGSSTDETARATAAVTVITPSDASDAEGGSANLNPATPGVDVVLADSRRIGNGDGSRVEMSFRNTISTAQEMERVRVNFYFQGNPGAGKDRPQYFDLVAADGTVLVSDHGIDEDFVPFTPSVSMNPGDLVTIDILLLDADGDPYKAKNADDFFVLTVIFEDGETRVYLVPSQYEGGNTGNNGNN